MSIISERITYLLESHQIKASELCRGTGITPPTFSKIMNKNQIPTVDTLYKISAFFKVSMEYLYTGEEYNCQQATCDASTLEFMNMFYLLSSRDQEEIKMLIKYKLTVQEHMGEYSSSESEKENHLHNFFI